MTGPVVHGGPYHDLPTKRELALHLGVLHLIPDGDPPYFGEGTLQGRLVRIVSPDAAVRSRWLREELERQHRWMHGL